MSLTRACSRCASNNHGNRQCGRGCRRTNRPIQQAWQVRATNAETFQGETQEEFIVRPTARWYQGGGVCGRSPDRRRRTPGSRRSRHTAVKPRHRQTIHVQTENVLAAIAPAVARCCQTTKPIMRDGTRRGRSLFYGTAARQPRQRRPRTCAQNIRVAAEWRKAPCCRCRVERLQRADVTYVKPQLIRALRQREAARGDAIRGAGTMRRKMRGTAPCLRHAMPSAMAQPRNVACYSGFAW